jgi:hypothetical protein
MKFQEVLKLIKMKKLLLLLILSLGLTGCYRQVSCPDFKKEILRWLPYQENDVIELISQSNDSTIFFFIKSIWVDHKSHYTTGYKCGTCDDYIWINQEDHSINTFHVDIHLNKNKIINQGYYIYDTYFTEYNATYLEEINYLFEKNKYEAVRVFEKNDLKGTFKKLIIAKDFGIIGLVDIHGNVWALKTESVIRKIDKQENNIVIHNTSC